MSDDLREREPDRTRGDDPTVDGTRSDQAGTGAGVAGPAPAGGEPRTVDRDDPVRLADSPAGDPEAPAGAGAPAGGGYGTASDRPSSGGSGDGEQGAGDDPSTSWLRDAPGGGSETTPNG